MRIRTPMTAGLLALTLSACGGGEVGTRDCPPVSRFATYRPPEATRILALDGSRLADLSPYRRIVVELDEVPRAVSGGFVAVEDRRFFQHGGVDYRAVPRAVVANLKSLSFAEGFSTITMQLARNVFPEELPRAKKLRRKMCEVQLAGAIERRFSKRQILERYINQVYMGDGLYGVEEAAQGYFRRSARQLTLPQSALLVGLVKSPEGYNPRKHPMRAIQRRNVVLSVMTREGLITEEERRTAAEAPLDLAPPREAGGSAPYVVAAVREELRERFGTDADVQGLRVFTGIDPLIQRAAHAALVAQIERVENGGFGSYPHARPEGALAPAEGSGSPYLQGTAIIVDTRTGAVRALVGGRDFTHSSYDRALQARRQPGSAFKPIVYAAALEAGLPASARIETGPVSVVGTQGTWRPEDLAPDTVKSLTVRSALALSSNNGAVRVGQWAGTDRVIRMARALGITTPIPDYPSIFLGSAEVSAAELVAAYATLGNGGNRVRPTLITRVEDNRGRILWQAPAAEAAAVDAGVAFLTVSLMEDVVDRGTATVVRKEGFWLPAAGKTGTTNDARDVWFVGMTPELAGAVWLGFDTPKTILPTAYGGTLAAPVWTEIMKAAYAERPAPGPWQPPAGLVSAPIDAVTGGLATDACPPQDLRVEYFLPGTEPTEYCPLHGSDGLFNRIVQGLRRIF
ncbi:MAG: PBP1A family penicillin-binding protein [Gemmatimonadota bacterium]